MLKGRNILQQTLLLWLWTKSHLALYVGLWLVAEGACVVAGLGYNGYDEDKREVRRGGNCDVSCMKPFFGV